MMQRSKVSYLLPQKLPNFYPKTFAASSFQMLMQYSSSLNNTNPNGC